MRFNMQSLSRALAAFGLALVLSACDIGEGNGIVSLEIIARDGSTDYQFRADQCEGFELLAVATFTDGQRLDYTSRVDWSITSGNAVIKELNLNLDIKSSDTEFTAAAAVFPQDSSLTEADKILVRADYISLSTTRELTVSGVTILAGGLSLESSLVGSNGADTTPARTAMVTDEKQLISSALALSDGTLSTNPFRGLEFSLQPSDNFSLEGFNATNQQILDTTDTPGVDTPTTVTATFCRSIFSNTYSAQITAHHYAVDDSRIKLQLISDFNGDGPQTIGSAPIRLPNKYNGAKPLAAVLAFPNGVTRNISSSVLFKYQASDFDTEDCTISQLSCAQGSTDCDSSQNTCSATVLSNGSILADDTNDGETTINAEYYFSPSDQNDNLNKKTTTAKVNVIPLKYDEPPFKLQDEGMAIIADSDVIDVVSTNTRFLRVLGLFEDEHKNEAYPLLLNPVFEKSDDTNLVSLPGANRLTGTGTAGESTPLITIEVNAINLPGGSDEPVAFDTGGVTNNLKTIQVKRQDLTPDNLFIDADGDATEDLTIQLAKDSELQLRSFIGYSDDAAPSLATAATIWISENPDVVAVGSPYLISHTTDAIVGVGNTTGKIHRLGDGDVIIHAYRIAKQADGTLLSEPLKSSITVVDPPTPE